MWRHPIDHYISNVIDDGPVGRCPVVDLIRKAWDRCLGVVCFMGWVEEAIIYMTVNIDVFDVFDNRRKRLSAGAVARMVVASIEGWRWELRWESS